MTNYEKRIAAGEIPPMKGLEWSFLSVCVEDILSGEQLLDNELVTLLDELKDEVDYYYKEELLKLEQLNKLIIEFKAK